MVPVFRITTRALLFSCASFCYMPRSNHTSSDRNIHRKSTLEKEREAKGGKRRFLGGLKLLSGERTEPSGCPSTSDGAERSPFHKSRRSSYLEMKLLTRLERSAASPAVTHPLHTHAPSHIHREEPRLGNGSYCVNGCQIWTTVFLFLRSGIS